MRLDRIEVQGFKSIRSMDLQLASLNVLIGANGAGKSNLISVFGLLNAIVDEHLQLWVARAGGAATVLRKGPKSTREIAIKLRFEKNAYELRLEHGQGDTLFFGQEEAIFVPWAKRKSLGVGHRETGLLDAVQRDPGTVQEYVLRALRSWRVYHFHDTSAAAGMKQKGPIDDNASLRPDAANLAAFLYRLRATAPHSYRQIVTAVGQVAPFFQDFQLRPDPLRPESIQLEWTERDSDSYFNASALSDGTLRFICLATLLLQPELPSMVLVDEPELGLHPYAVTQLAGMLRSASARAQLLVATQSVTLMNQFDPEDVVVVDRSDGQSTFRRVTGEEVAKWLDEYTLGEIWEKNILGGRPGG
jgi:predicted ATPase